MPKLMSKKKASAAVQDHAEAVRLAWKSRHVPVGTILLVILILGAVIPTILTILAQGPVNPIP
jgi:hypothetical protein